MSRHVNIPVFIPHLGCPNQCVFCNQRTISGVEEFNPDSLVDIIENSLSTVLPDDEVEIAFFGGSFTGIDEALMIRLLEIAHSYILSGKVHSIRCSTRPDYINEHILDILERYGVRVIELGLQSASDRVLEKTKRGHSFEAEKYACRLIVECGFRLVGQMMIGLPLSDEESEAATADFIISSGAFGARIYPTVVFSDTELCNMAKRGEYKPLSLDEAIDRSAKVLSKFVFAGVEVIRIGLCASENLSSRETYFAGPNHSALGELVMNKLYYVKICEEASSMKLSDKDILNIFVSRGSASKAVGQKKKNKILLPKVLGVADVRFFELDTLRDYEIRLETETGENKCT